MIRIEPLHERAMGVRRLSFLFFTITNKAKKLLMKIWVNGALNGEERLTELGSFEFTGVENLLVYKMDITENRKGDGK